MHIVGGVGDLLGLIREELPLRPGSAKLGPEAGRGESEYTKYDRDIADETVKWLKAAAAAKHERPWALYVGFVSPHFPLIAPSQFYDLYPEDAVPWPGMYSKDERPRHPFTDAMRRCLSYDDAFDDAMVRRAIAAYFGLTTFLDDNIGKILHALETTGLMENTRVVYATDHGDNLGTRGMWGKSTMYEESAGIPMIAAGPDVPRGNVCATPVTLADGFPTIVQCVGARPAAEDATLPGTSLFEIANGYVPRRTILSEYHAAGAATGSFMIRHGKWKYIHYAGMPPMLFDLESDPFERRDLGRTAGQEGVIAACEAALRGVVNPEAAHAQAMADQKARIALHGGVDAILKKGTFRYSPPPGSKASFY